MSQVRSKETRRPFLFALAGLLACAIAIYLIYDHQQPRSTVPGSDRYNYQIEQSETAAAHYTESAYFDASGSPGDDNTAYIQSLTDYLTSVLSYRFTGSEVADLRYSYKADAVVRSTFSGKGDSADNTPSVWSQNTRCWSLLPAARQPGSLHLPQM